MTNLCSLENLNLQGSLSYGNMTELLDSLSNCSNKLSELNLADNNISGTLPPGIFQQFADLVTLDASNNQLTGPLPVEIGMLTGLNHLDLSYNNLAGDITEEHFANLRSLKYIDLSSNDPLNIVVDPTWIAPFRLERASFPACMMGPQFPTWLQWSVDIWLLEISNTGIKDKLPDWFWTTFSKLEELDMSNNQISGVLPTNMETMALSYLYLGSNQISGQLPPLPRKIVKLDVSNNSLSGSLPSEFGAQNQQMDTLILSFNNLSGHIPESFCRMEQLAALDLANNHFEGELPQCFGMTGMVVVLLQNNRFSGSFPVFLERSTELQLVDLSRNNFSGKLPAWIGDKKELVLLLLSHNVFSGIIPINITNLSNLRQLNLAGNSLSGNIPWRLSNLEAMKEDNYIFNLDIPDDSSYNNLSVFTKRTELFYGPNIFSAVNIDLSSNYLVGQIPEEIASLALLKNLNLSRNYLSGKIPQKIGSLWSLESLDLSRNKLSGEIPPSLSNLSYLSDLDLSHNNLSGRIPSGSQLDTLYFEHPDMYSSNDGLFGFPLQRNYSEGIAPKQGYHDHSKTRQVAEPMFFYLGLVSGFVVGLWVVFCTILFKKTWRIAYFSLFDKACDKIYVFTVVTWARVSQKTNVQ